MTDTRKAFGLSFFREGNHINCYLVEPSNPNDKTYMLGSIAGILVADRQGLFTKWTDLMQTLMEAQIEKVGGEKFGHWEKEYRSSKGERH